MNMQKSLLKLTMVFNNEFLKCGLINIQSVRNKTNEIHELIIDKSFDILCVTETWLNDLDTAVVSEMTPSTHTFVHLPRVGQMGGGVGLFLSNSFTHIRMVKRDTFTSFEFIEVNFKHQGSNLVFIIVYRPPNSNTSDFFEQFDELLERIDTIANKVIIGGDFNFWMDVESNPRKIRFNELLESHQLSNFVNRVTSSTGHMLDLVISPSRDDLVKNIEIEEHCRFTSIHKLITFNIPLKKDKWIKKIVFRNKSDFEPNIFIHETTRKFSEMELTRCIHNNLIYKNDCADCLAMIYNSINKNEYDNMCPESEKTIVIVNKSPWFNNETLQKKREKRRYEKKWLRFKTNETWLDYCAIRNQYNDLLKQTKIQYYRRKINEVRKDLRKLYYILNGLTSTP